MRNSALSGGDIPEAAEERRDEVETGLTNVHSHGIIAGDTLEPETRGPLEPVMVNTGRTKRKEQERQIYVQVSEDNSDPEHMTHKQKRSPFTIEHIEKVNVITIRNVLV